MKRFPKLSIRNVSLCRKVTKTRFSLNFQQHSSFSVNKSNNSLVDLAPKSISVTDVKNPWVEQKDPAGSNLVYYWNPETNETTHLGSPKPRNWLEVKDPNGSELSYWWDPDAQETTPLGASKPPSIVPVGNTTYIQPFGIQDNQQPQTLGSSMKTMFLWGAGMSFAFALVGSIFR